MSSSPTTSGQTSLIPINDCVLVKLDRTDRKESKYDTRTSGIVFGVPDNEHAEYTIGDSNTLWPKHNVAYLLNKRVYFEEYKEGARIKRDGELYCFIKIEDIRGFEEVT